MLFVKLMDSNTCYRSLLVGAPPGTRSEANDFKLLLNDLSFDIDYMKYVDDATAAYVLWSSTTECR